MHSKFKLCLYRQKIYHKNIGRAKARFFSLGSDLCETEHDMANVVFLTRMVCFLIVNLKML